MLKPSPRIPWRVPFQRLNLPAISDIVHGQLIILRVFSMFLSVRPIEARTHQKGVGGP